MCYPMLIAAAFTVAAGYVSYTSSKNATEYEGKVAEVNKKVVESQAVDAERQGQIEGQQQRLKTRMQIATQQVGFSAQNVEQTGTALDILGDTAMFGQIDENRIAANAQRKAFGFRFQGYDIEAKHQLAQYEGKMQRVGTILSTAGSLASMSNSSGGLFSRTGGGAGNLQISQVGAMAQQPISYQSWTPTRVGG